MPLIISPLSIKFVFLTTRRRAVYRRRRCFFLLVFRIFPPAAVLCFAAERQVRYEKRKTPRYIITLLYGLDTNNFHSRRHALTYAMNRRLLMDRKTQRESEREKSKENKRKTFTAAQRTAASQPVEQYYCCTATYPYCT